ICALARSSGRTGINQVFVRCLRGRAVRAPNLYILGDLFEYWAGDDDIGDPFNAKVVAALAECARGGTRIRVMHGNRDFLFGPAFAQASGAQLVDDPVVLDLFGKKTVLTHGDALCTDASEYQA